MAKLASICRRVYRIFSHAYFHHRQIFDAFEAETFLCRRFTIFVTKYKLMTRDNLIVPILDSEDIDIDPATTESEAWLSLMSLYNIIIICYTFFQCTYKIFFEFPALGDHAHAVLFLQQVSL